MIYFTLKKQSILVAVKNEFWEGPPTKCNLKLSRQYIYHFLCLILIPARTYLLSEKFYFTPLSQVETGLK